MKNREIHLRDVAKALAWMLRLLVKENRRFKSRQVGKGVLFEQKPAVNYSSGWNSRFSKSTSTKTVHVELLFVWFPHKTSMFVPFVVSLCLIILEDENPPVASSHNQTQPTPVSPQAVSPCGGYLAVANAMTVTVLMAQIWVKLQKVIES